MQDEVIDASVQGTQPDPGPVVVQLGPPETPKGSHAGDNGDSGRNPQGAHDRLISNHRLNGGVRDALAHTQMGQRGVGRHLEGAVEAAQVKFQAKCKVCQLSQTNIEIYTEMHESIISGKLSQSAAMEWTNKRLEDDPSFHKLNGANMSLHFNKHVPVKQRVAYEINRQLVPNMMAMTPASEAIEGMIEVRTGNEADDFRKIAELSDILKAKLIILDANVIRIDSETNEQVIDKFSLQAELEVVKEIRACVNDLNRMRQSERLTSIVIRALLDRLTLNIIPQLLTEYALVTDTLKSKSVSSGIIEMIDARLRLRTAQIIGETCRQAVLDVSREFHL